MIEYCERDSSNFNFQNNSEFVYVRPHQGKNNKLSAFTSLSQGPGTCEVPGTLNVMKAYLVDYLILKTVL